MTQHRRFLPALAPTLALLAGLVPPPGRAQAVQGGGTAPANPASANPASGSPTPAGQPATGATPAALPDAADAITLPEVAVQAQAQAAERARNAIATRLGASTYTIGGDTVRGLPGGDNLPLNQVLLQAPGVVQDSLGEIHVRGDHRNLQYRINGVTIPESIGGFGNILDPRAFRSFSLITGALPAQYGYRTAGIVDLTLRSGALEPGGSATLYGGTRGVFEPSFEYGNTAGGWDYFVTGSWLRTDQGVENPTSSFTARNDLSNQWRGLLSAAKQLDQDNRLSIISGGTYNHFRIPTNPAQQPQFTAFGLSDLDSGAIRESQTERTIYNVVALNSALGPDIDLQTSFFSRYNSIHFRPDLVGDLIFNGVAADVRRSSFVNGLQTDGAWRAAADHTVRFGTFTSRESTRAFNRSTVLPLDADGEAIDSPEQINDGSTKVGWLYGAYLQDEWRLTDQVTVNYGARFDYMDYYTRNAQLSPRVNVVYRPLPDTTLHAGYSRYFTPPPLELIAPTTLDKFAGTTQQPEITRNDRVKPERSHYFDVGVTQRFGKLTLGVDGYYRIVRDLLDEGQFGQALVYAPFNYRQGRVYGVEFTGSYKLDNLTLYANLAISRSVAKGIESGQFNFEPDELAYADAKYVRTDHDQLYTASAGAVWTPRDGTRLSASYLYGSGLRRGFANTQKLSDYNVVNVGVAQDFTLGRTGKWTARLDILNLLDNTYILRDGTGIGVSAPQYGLRRGFFLGLTKYL